MREKKRVSFFLQQPTISLLNRYLQAYAEIYGVKPDRDLVANQIFTRFIETDRVFIDYERQRSLTGPEPDRVTG